LGDDSQGAGFKTKNYWQANEAFFPDQTNFHTLAIWLNRQHRTHSIVQEISRLDDLSRLVQNLMKPKTNKLQRGKDSGTFRPRKTTQNSVADGAPITIGIVEFVQNDPG
jgi:hypothetical protein